MERQTYSAVLAAVLWTAEKPDHVACIQHPLKDDPIALRGTRWGRSSGENSPICKERKMETKCMRRNRGLSSWCGAVVLAVSALCVGVTLAGAQARHYQVAILTP